MSTTIKGYLATLSPEELAKFATKAGTSVGHLKQLAGGHRKPSLVAASKLAEASGGRLTVAGLRPDLAALIGTEQAA
ncbi:MAG: helix-turn-helix transcriptional regulator [Gammaproteobacteria bacterium]|nr:helix-turn-helix transcriptional regulator [Gammaproteobacteria bacterium]